VVEKQGNLVEAEKLFRRVLEYYEKTHSGNDLDTINCMCYLASNLETQKSYRMALDYYQGVYEKVVVAVTPVDVNRFIIKEAIARVQKLHNQGAINKEELGLKTVAGHAIRSSGGGGARPYPQPYPHPYPNDPGYGK
jgi:hypothetical protein